MVRIEDYRETPRGHRVLHLVGKGSRPATMPLTVRHAAITDALDAGVALIVAKILARHADPRTTGNYGRARSSLDRHGVHFLTAHVAGSE